MTKALRVGSHMIIVDDADIEKLLSRRWSVRNKGTNLFYAVASYYDRNVPTHEFLFGRSGTGANLLPDHKNGNGLDNRSVNFRWATREQNMWNRRKHHVSETSPLKGVTIQPNGKIRVVITKNKKPIILGFFTDIIKAGHAYDEAARREFGEFARVNFPQLSELVPEPVLSASDITVQGEWKISSPFRGVSREIREGRIMWKAKITVNGRAIHIGRYHSEIEASDAYLAACKKYRG